jgi:hypothetical protein
MQSIGNGKAIKHLARRIVSNERSRRQSLLPRLPFVGQRRRGETTTDYQSGEEQRNEEWPAKSHLTSHRPDQLTP